jgi:pullulanase/glycogen debranching enzyme
MPSSRGVNFSVFSKHATRVRLLLFDRVDDARPAREVPIDPVANRTYHYWHVFVPNLRPGQIYGYQVAGPSDPPSGMRFDPGKVLLDPYGRGWQRVSPEGELFGRRRRFESLANRLAPGNPSPSPCWLGGRGRCRSVRALN